MSKLVDKLERVSEGRDQPLGFGAAINRTKTLPMAVIGSIPEGKTELAATAKEANVDAILITVESPRKIDDAVAQLKGENGDIPRGIALDTATKEDIEKLVDAGCDFIVFSPAGTPANVLNEERIGKVLRVDPSMDDSLAKSIGRLSVDAVLLGPLGEGEHPLTVNGLMLYERLAAWSGKHILAAVPPGLPVEDIESFWGIGARGVVVDLSLKDPGQRLVEVKEAIGKLPVRKKKPQGRISASLPHLGDPPAEVPPEEEDDE
jgi:hypothetical protein